MTDARPIEIDGYLNYDEEKDVYWHGILGWVPDYVEEMKDNPIGTNKGELYRYLYHTGYWGEEVHVYFKKLPQNSDGIIKSALSDGERTTNQNVRKTE